MLEQNASLLSRFIGTVKQSWSRRSSDAVDLPSRDDPQATQWDAFSTVIQQKLPVSAGDTGRREEDLNDWHGSPVRLHHSTELQRIHSQLVEKLEPLLSESTSEFSARRFAVLSELTL